MWPALLWLSWNLIGIENEGLTSHFSFARELCNLKETCPGLQMLVSQYCGTTVTNSDKTASYWGQVQNTYDFLESNYFSAWSTHLYYYTKIWHYITTEKNFFNVSILYYSHVFCCCIECTFNWIQFCGKAVRMRRRHCDIQQNNLKRSSM